MTDQTSEPEKWDAEKAIDDLLVYMNEHGFKPWRSNGTYTFFHDGSGLTIEIRMGLPSGVGRRRKSEGSDRFWRGFWWGLSGCAGWWSRKARRDAWRYMSQ